MTDWVTPFVRGARAEAGLSRNPPLIVELFGQPGAGKSTIARAAAEGSELLGRSSLGTAWKQQSVLLKTAFLARAIMDGACLARAVGFAAGARLFRGDSLSRLARLLIKSHWFRSQAGPLLLEEGHLQDLWSILYSAGRNEPDPRLLAPLIRCLYRGVDVQIVYLELDPKDAFDRIRARSHGKSRLDRLPQEELRKQLTSRAKLPSRLVDAARLAGLSVESLDASLPVETAAGQLRAMMQRRLPAAPR